MKKLVLAVLVSSMLSGCAQPHTVVTASNPAYDAELAKQTKILKESIAYIKANPLVFKKADCDLAWSHTQYAINQLAYGKIQSSSDVVIQTFTVRDSLNQEHSLNAAKLVTKNGCSIQINALWFGMPDYNMIANVTKMIKSAE
jgi:PBP1b-binding outer membrane lipoprotein LpoB